MKKIFMIGVALAMLLGLVRAQSVEFYSFDADTVGAAYSPLADATVLKKTQEIQGENFGYTFFNLDESLLHVDEQELEIAGINIGFDFKFGGRTYDKFAASGMGYIILGEKDQGKVVIPSLLQGQLAQMPYPRIGVSCQGKVWGTKGVYYQLEGETPNRVLTVEFSEMKYAENAEGDDLFNFQLKLYESDSRIEFVFDGWTIPEEAPDAWVIGLRDNVQAHFRKLQDGNSWCKTEQAWSMQYWANGSTFKEGLKYTFSLPAECEKPTQVVESINLTSYTDYVYADVKVSKEGSSEGFMVLASENPIEGTLEARDYRVGEEVLGTKVIAREDWDSWSIDWQDEEETIFRITHEGLEGNKQYYYAAYLLNYKCTNTAFSDKVEASVKTQTSAPESLDVTSVSLNSLGFSAKANELGEEVLIVMTTVKGKNKYGNTLFIGDFAVPAGDLQVGDTLRKEDGSFGGVVLYKGEASANITCDVNLKDNTVYHFGAFSISGEDGYSSTFAQADTVTEARIPFYADFANMKTEESPYGWTGTQGFLVNYNGEAILAEMEANPDGIRREVVLALPPMDIPDNSNAVLETNYSLDPYGFKMVENDSIVFEISQDGGKSYDMLKSVTMNSPTIYVRRLAIPGYTGVKQALIRIRYVSNSKEAHTLEFTKIQVLPLAFCDVPTSVYVGSAYGENASVSWTPSLSEEKAWNISYSMKEDGEYSSWSEPLNVNTNPYQLSGLYGKTYYGVRVRAVCGVGQVSEWSEVEDFQSGLKPSFIEDFDNMELYVSSWYPDDTTVNLPDGWGNFGSRQQLSTSLTSLPDTLRSSDLSYFYGDEISYDWKTNRFPEAGVSNGSLSFKMNNFKSQAIKVPLFGLDGEGSPVFRMKMAYGNMTQAGVFEAVESTSAEYSFHLLISTDGGSTYVVDEALGTWTGDELATIGGEYWFEKDLSAYSGAISLMLLVQGVEEEEPVSNHILYIDSLSVLNQCAIARLLQARNITQTSAELIWEKDLMVDEWIVKVEDGSKTELSKTSAAELLLDNLEMATTYTVSVAHLCGEDTSAWSQVVFTTGGESCDPISNLAVSEITRQSARLTWEGSAENYRVRIRPVNDKSASWTYFEVKGAKTYVVNNLLKLTEYEGGVQSICGMAVSDTSEYVAFEPFTTLDLTCFAPTKVVAKTIDHQSASVTWEGESEKYQVEYSPRLSDDVIGMVEVNEKKTLITGLEPESEYKVRVRSICGAADTSEWSEYVIFTTGVMPPCPAPTNLRVESITTNSATLLWDMEEDVNFFILRYRATSVTSWDSIKDLNEKTYELTGLEPATAYVWSVMTQCTDGRYSGWGTQNRFETEEDAANENVSESGLFITTSLNQIHLMNPFAIQIDRVRIYGTEGKLLEDYTVGSNENVILTTNQRTKVVIVVVESQGIYYRFKTLLP